MNRIIFLFLLAAVVGISPAYANFDITTGSGTHVFAIDAANQGSALCAATSTECPSTVLIDKTGTPVVILQPGQASSNNSAPVVLPAVQVPADLCTLQTKTRVAFSTTAATFQLVAPVALDLIHICSIFIQPAAVDVVNLIEGTGGTCTGGTPAAVAGSLTAANGMAVTATNGFAPGNGGASIVSTNTAGDGLCLTHTGSGILAGYMTYVQSLL